MDNKLLSGHSSVVTCVSFSRDNRFVVSGGNDGTIIVHSTSSNKVEYRADNVIAEGVYDLCYLPTGSLVACGYSDEGDYNGLKVFSPSLELVQTLVGHDGPVLCVTVSPSGSHLASGGGNDKKLIIWSEPGEGGELARVQVLEDHTSDIEAVLLLPRRQAAGYWKHRQAHQTLQLQRGKCHLSAHAGGPHQPTTFFDELIKFWNLPIDLLPIPGPPPRPDHHPHSMAKNCVVYK